MIKHNISKKIDLANKAILALVFIILISAIAIMSWRENQMNDGTVINQTFLTVLIVISVVAFIGLWLPSSARTVLVLCNVGLVSGIYMFELYVITDKDRRSKADVVQQVRDQGKPQAVASMYPIDLIEDDASGGYIFSISAYGAPLLPLSGISNNLTIHCKEYGRDNFGWVMDDSDEHGFNNRTGLWKDADVEALFVGDSFTHGECVPRDKGLVAATRKMLPTTINLGMPGNGPLLELASLMEYAVHVRPQRVVWVFYENDMDDLKKHIEIPFLRRYLEDDFSQNLIERQSIIDKQLRQHHDELLAATLERDGESQKIFSKKKRPLVALKNFLLLRNLRIKMGFRAFDHPQSIENKSYGFNKLEDILRKAKMITESWGGQFFFVYLPSYSEVVYKNSNSLLLRKAVLDVSAKIGVSMIDISKSFSHIEDVEMLWQCEKCHYTAEGYAIAGEAVARALVQAQ